MAATARVDSKGRITLPRELRERMHLEPGDIVFFDLENGVLRLGAAKNPFDVLGALALEQRRRGKGISLRDLAERDGIEIDE